MIGKKEIERSEEMVRSEERGCGRGCETQRATNREREREKVHGGGTRRDEGGRKWVEEEKYWRGREKERERYRPSRGEKGSEKELCTKRRRKGRRRPGRGPTVLDDAALAVAPQPHPVRAM